MDKEIELRLEEYAEEKAYSLESLDIEDLMQLVKDGAEWYSQQKTEI